MSKAEARLGAIRPAQSASIPNSADASDYLWQWGQFLDHDLDETPLLDPPERFPIPVPAGDPYFDPTGLGSVPVPPAVGEHGEYTG